VCLNISFEAQKNFHFVLKQKKEASLAYYLFCLRIYFQIFLSSLLCYSLSKFLHSTLSFASHPQSLHFFKFFFSPVSGLRFIPWTPLIMFSFCPSVPLFSQTLYTVFYHIAEPFQYERCSYVSYYYL